MTGHRALAALAVAAVLVAVIGLRQATADRSASSRSAAPSAAPNRDSAVAAATNFLLSIDLDVLLDDRRRNRVLARFGAPTALRELRRMYAAEKRRVSASYRERPRFARAALVGYRVDEFAQSDARVSIWAATVGGSGSFAPVTGWSTTTVTLVWKTGSWKVSDVRDEPGPSPDWPIETLASEGRRFQEYRYAP
jgi:hypothetical protein